jgi:Protein of unknown function (DUF429)
VSYLAAGITDDTIVEQADRADKLGIDCPLGWPDAFVDFVTAHRAGNVGAPDTGRTHNWRQQLANRRTDFAVRDLGFGLTPLSVAADRIAWPAMRAAALLSRLAPDGPPDRGGTGRVVEVYPAASLRVWGLPHRGYKGPSHSAELQALAGELRAKAPWLDLSGYETPFATIDHCFDAVVAALTTRAAALGLTHPPTDEQADAAAREGWIAVPNGSLADLVPVSLRSDPAAPPARHR